MYSINNYFFTGENQPAQKRMFYALFFTIFTVIALGIDSVFFTNATANFTSSEQKGRFLMKSVTMIIFYVQKLQSLCHSRLIDLGVTNQA